MADTIAPSNITDLVATPMSVSRIQLRWTAPGSVGVLGQASAYEIRRSSSPITNNLQCDAATGIAHTMIPKSSGLLEIKEIDGHLPQSTYYFCVRAIDSSGLRNSWSGTVSATTYAPTDLVPPADITTASATVESYHQIKLSWTAVGDNGNTGSASSYEIRRRSTPIVSDDDCSAGIFVSNSVVASTTGTPLEFTVSGLSSGTVHYFCIRAFDQGGNRSLWSGVLQATTPFANQSPVIQLASNLTIDLGTEATLDASLSSDPDASFCGAQTNLYEYNWRVISKPPLSNLATGDIQSRTTKLAKVLPDKNGEYVFEFSFKDNAGSCAGGNRTSVSLVTVQVNLVPIDAPAYVEAQAGGTSAFVQWWPVTGATSYTVYYSPSPGVSTASASFGPVTNPYATITGLTSGTLYYFRVVANNSGGYSLVSAMEPRAFTTSTPPGMSVAGTHVDISAGQGLNSGYLASVALDHASGKLLVVTRNGGTLFEGKPSLFRCNLDGTSCTHTDISAGQGPGSSGSHSSIEVDHVNGKLLVVTSNYNNSSKPSLFRCNLDGTSCTHTDISVGQGANSCYQPKIVLDHTNGKLLVVTHNGANNYKPSLFRCNLDGTSCTHTDISAGQGGSSGGQPSVVLDHVNGKLLVVTTNSANNAKPSLFRCNLDGTSCTHTDISAGQGTSSGGQPSVVLDRVNAKLLVVTANYGNSSKPSLFRCNLDGTSCTHTDISAGQGSESGVIPSAALDQINGKLLVATQSNGTYNSKPSLFRCNLDGSSCTYTDISAGQGNNSGLFPSAILVPISGKLLVVTNNVSNNAKPSLFIW
ncbi:fibronectin type III domain-containing protein [Leptospira chreensis]|uniref:fibronectin type III domain-containing protein n=1 Tax=Leptospira chreensis TaxID=2810035 RepID=UPI002FC615FD